MSDELEKLVERLAGDGAEYQRMLQEAAKVEHKEATKEQEANQ